MADKFEIEKPGLKTKGEGTQGVAAAKGAHLLETKATASWWWGLSDKILRFVGITRFALWLWSFLGGSEF